MTTQMSSEPRNSNNDPKKWKCPNKVYRYGYFFTLDC